MAQGLFYCTSNDQLDSRSQIPLSSRSSPDSTCWISQGKRWRRQWTAWGTNVTWAFQRGCYSWASVCCVPALQLWNRGGGQRADAMLAQRWRDQIRIWKQELFIDLLAVNLSQNHSPISFNFLPFPLYSLYKPPQDWGWKNGWEWLWLGMSHAHREPSTQALYVAVWRAAPSPLCCSSTPQRLPFSLGLAEGEVGPLLSRGILRGDCKACDCVGLYFCGEKEGAKREKERARGRQRGVAEESWDTDSLVKQQPQRARARGGGEKGKSQEENGTSRKTKRSSLDYVTSVILLLCLCFPLLLLIRSLHLAPCTPALQFYNKFCPHPHPSSLNSHPPHYITRIPLTRGLREMSGVAGVIISALFTSQLYFTI